MMEEAPKNPPTSTALEILMKDEYSSAVSRMNEEYLYWDKVKYQVPKGLQAEDFWNAVKYSRRLQAKTFRFSACTFFLKETAFMQESLHLFDMHAGGMLATSDLLTDKNRHYYVLSSLMEEAIASSQMEGASTTRKIAKEMLRKQAKPKDKSQQMIVNNYNTIRYLSDHKDDELTPVLLLEIHRQITEHTMDNPSDEGKFRSDNAISVVNGITGEVVHEPPSYTVIPETIQQLCTFANDDSTYIHPVIKAIIIHFMISYLHPFVDGNGRTARSLFYWYMLRKGYWLTEFLSISRVIYKSKGQYEKAFLYTEHDDFDIGYFIHYNLKVVHQALEELQLYLERKTQRTNALMNHRIPGLNERQMQIVQICAEKPTSLFTSKDLETRFTVSVKTLRSDLEGLVRTGLMEPVALNKRLTGYTRSRNFEKILEEISGN